MPENDERTMKMNVELLHPMREYPAEMFHIPSEGAHKKITKLTWLSF
jgi:hypothetical protein